MSSLEQMPQEINRQAELANAEALKKFGYFSLKFREACQSGDIKKAESFFDSLYTYSELIEDSAKQIEAKAVVKDCEAKLEELKKRSRK